MSEQDEKQTGASAHDDGKPGGAEGGEDSPSKDRNVLPADDDAPLGDTDQHSS